MSHATIKIGVRANRLGRSLGDQIAEQLRPHFGSAVFTFHPIAPAAERTGSHRTAWPGVALERALVKGEIDLAIQNAKDLSPEADPAVTIAAVTERFTRFDVLIARDETIFDELPEGAAVSAHTPLRRAMLLYYRRDLRIVDFEGPLEERIRMLDSGEVDGLVVSASAVEHLGYQDHVTEIFTTEVLMPAPGQGVAVVQAKTGSRELIRLAKHIDHPEARAELETERAFLRELRADPTMPVGASASVEDDTILLEGVVADRDGRKLYRDTEKGDRGDEEQLGTRLARRLLLEGAKRLLAGIGSDAP
jgi:hydroxymethylbilane synthase